MHNISDKEWHFWKNNSYLVVKGLFKEEVPLMSEKVDELAKKDGNNHPWLCFHEMDRPEQLSRIEHFCPFIPELDNILRGEKILHIINRLMGEAGVLYKDRINFKYPEGGAHSAHQDGVAYESSNQTYFDDSTPPFISIFISVDPANQENGCLELAPHWALDNLSILPMEKPRADHPNFSKIADDIESSIDWISIETEPGDVIFFTERIPHRSKPNQSQKSRRILYGVYNPMQLGDKRMKYFEEKKKNINDARYMVGNPHAPVK